MVPIIENKKSGSRQKLVTRTPKKPWRRKKKPGRLHNGDDSNLR